MGEGGFFSYSCFSELYYTIENLSVYTDSMVATIFCPFGRSEKVRRRSRTGLFRLAGHTALAVTEANTAMQHKGYTAVVSFGDEDRIFHGHLVGTHDQVYFEGDSVDALEQAFREAVDDYLAYCEQTGRAPSKPVSGRVNLRMGPELHQRAAVEAARRGKSLNAFISEAVEKVLS